MRTEKADLFCIKIGKNEVCARMHVSVCVYKSAIEFKVMTVKYHIFLIWEYGTTTYDSCKFIMGLCEEVVDDRNT